MSIRSSLGSLSLVVTVIGCSSNKPTTQPAPVVARRSTVADTTQCHMDTMIQDTVLHRKIIRDLPSDSLYALCSPGHPWLKVF
jgi:hypothetical protein